MRMVGREYFARKGWTKNRRSALLSDSFPNSQFQNSMKGIGRKCGEDAPKWISFGKKDNNADAIKNTRNFKVNDVIKVCIQIRTI